LAKLGLAESAHYLRGAGCEQCHGTGYKGRIAIFESFEATETIRERILAGSGPDGVRAAAPGIGILSDSASKLVLDGVTTADEAARTLF
jgi:type II secretory ATPase GspE/PulE/Tfp pilus assembly ATPase PilB-like protein